MSTEPFVSCCNVDECSTSPSQMHAQSGRSGYINWMGKTCANIGSHWDNPGERETAKGRQVKKSHEIVNQLV